MAIKTATSGRATLQDVARAVGVSDVTVYNALNGKGRVSDATRERVMATASELGYRSNLLASSLKTGRSYGIGVLVHNLTSFTASLQLAGAEVAAREAGYHLVVTTHGKDAAAAVQTLEAMRDRQLDGVISISSVTNFNLTVAHHLPKLHLPFVFGFHAPPLAPGEVAATDTVLVDQSGGMRLAVRHLLQSGRRRLLYLGLKDNVASDQRLQGVRDEHRAHGLTWHENQAVLAEGWVNRQAIQALRENWDDRELPDAIVAASDMLAGGVLQFLGERGIAVPETVAVTGFDNAYMAEALRPSLTTVGMPLQSVGATCVQRLLARLNAPDSWQPTVTRLPCQLMVRQSCGANPNGSNRTASVPSSTP